MKYDEQSIKKRNKIMKNIKIVLNIILIIFIYNLVLLFISSIHKGNNNSLFGYKAYVITTQSMEPNIRVGDVVIVKKVKEDELKEGDIITFNQNDETITHRISKVENENNEKKYMTKGDNNNVEDKEKVEQKQIQGKNILTIPKFGKIITILQNRIIFLIVILVILILCFFKIQKDERRDNRREKKKIEKEKQNQN